MRARTKRRICGIVFGMCLVGLLGLVGGMERFDISVGAGAGLAALLLAAGFVAGCKAGVIAL